MLDEFQCMKSLHCVFLNLGMILPCGSAVACIPNWVLKDKSPIWLAQILFCSPRLATQQRALQTRLGSSCALPYLGQSALPQLSSMASWQAGLQACSTRHAYQAAGNPPSLLQLSWLAKLSYILSWEEVKPLIKWHQEVWSHEIPANIHQYWEPCVQI